MITTRLPHAAARATATPCRWPPDLQLGELAAGLAAHSLLVHHPQDGAERAATAQLAPEEDV
jgi:hypothetical protein